LSTVLHRIFPQPWISPRPIGLADIVAHLDDRLKIIETPDYALAHNGLQVESRGEICAVAAAVDASQATIDAAVAAGADLLLVHHGLFWDGGVSLTARRYRRLRALIEADLALYSAHLPLDVHQDVGNNILLARKLGIDVQGRFGEYQGHPVGFWGTVDSARDELAERLSAAVEGSVRTIPGGPERVRRVGVVTGGASSMIAAAAAAGLDTFITGEASHHVFFDAEEGGMNLLLGGHYATETFGVRALAGELKERFDLPWTFLHHPTGL